MKRRDFLHICIASAAAAAIPATAWAAATKAQTIDLYRDPACDCCERWAQHMRDNGFVLRLHSAPAHDEYRKRFGVPEAIAGCHTARMGDYTFEGLVPAREIKRFLAGSPDGGGLAVPSMPPGAPGMEGQKAIPYDVFLFKRDGTYSVYAHYDAS